MRTVDNNEPNSENEPMGLLANLSSTVVHRCAWCDEDLTRFNMLADAHRAVCPKRPIAPGDLVSWDLAGTDRNFIHGEVERIDDGLARVRVTNASPSHASTFGPHLVSHIHQPVTSLRRIPRPETQARQSYSERLERALKERPVVNPEAFGDAARRGLKHGPGGSGRSGPCDPDCWKCSAERDSAADATAAAEAAAPVLVDGLTSEQCSLRWSENRLAVEGGAAPPNVLTPDQIAAGRAEYQAGPGAHRSKVLRELIAAGPSLDGSTYGRRLAAERRERDRARIKVDVQVID